MNNKQPTFFISHGGGPCFWMDWEPRDLFMNLEQSLSNFQSHLDEKPKAIIVISAHWIEDDFTIQAKEEPGMLYDYYGFPEHTYHLKYNAKGSSYEAESIAKLIKLQGVNVKLDHDRDYDHGLFVPMMKMFPDTEIPVIQLSLKKGFSVFEHYELGQKLALLRDQGYLIIGSGLSYHNLRHLNDVEGKSKPFDEWLQRTLTLTGDERKQTLIDWEKAPNARFCHPMEDHLAPLFVVVGAAEDAKMELIYNETMKGWNYTNSSFKFS